MVATMLATQLTWSRVENLCSFSITPEKADLPQLDGPSKQGRFPNVSKPSPEQFSTNPTCDTV